MYKNTHISQAFSVQEVEPKALEAIAAGSSPHKLWSVNLLPPALSGARRDRTVARHCHSNAPAQSQVPVIWSHPLAWRKAGELHKEASIIFINGFWPGKGASNSAAGDSELLEPEQQRTRF